MMSSKSSKKINGAEQGGTVAIEGASVKKSRSKGHDPAPDEQEAKVDALRTSLGQLSARSRHYCSDACLRRYLRARNWNAKKAEKMLKESLKWRASFKPECIRWPDVAKEAETGKVYRANFVDKLGRTILILRPARQNTKDQTGQIRQLVYCMENAILNLPPEQEQMVWLIDFEGWSMSNSVPLSAARETAAILQNHYPERLAIAILYNPPRLFETFWALVKPFLDPKTHKKVKFVYPGSRKLLEELFDMDKLEVAFGGNSTAEFNFEEYGRLMHEDDAKMAACWEAADA